MAESLQKNNHKNAILFFVKYPEKGKVKKRLAVELDELFVKKLYTYFVEDILSCLTKINAEILICYYPHKYLNLFQKWLGERYQYISQQGNNLGSRMNHCFKFAFQHNFEKVLLIGSDSPDLPFDFFNKAYDSLNSFDSVIGPCSDGGYYLFGCTKQSFISEMFSNIPWSTSVVFKQTMDVLNKQNKKVYKLPIWNDVDTYDDLQELFIKNKNTWFKDSKTMQLIKSSIFDK